MVKTNQKKENGEQAVPGPRSTRNCATSPIRHSDTEGLGGGSWNVIPHGRPHILQGLDVLDVLDIWVLLGRIMTHLPR